MIFINLLWRYDFKCKLTRRMIFGIFLLSGRLTIYKALKKSCKIPLPLKLPFKVIISNHSMKYEPIKSFHEINPFLWQVIAESCGIYITCINSLLKTDFTGERSDYRGRAFSGTHSIPLLIKISPSNLLLIAWYWHVSLSEFQNKIFVYLTFLCYQYLFPR